jgi:hypothetical protein
VASDADRDDEIAGEDAEQEKPEGEGEFRSGALELAHALRRFRFVSASELMKHCEKKERQDEIVDRAEPGFVGFTCGPVDQEVRESGHQGDRDDGAEDIRRRRLTPAVAGGEKEGADDLGAGDHHERQRQDCQEVH